MLKALNFQEVTPERDNSDNDEEMNIEEETIGDCIVISEIPLPPDDVVVAGDTESEELIPKEEIKEEVDDTLEDASDSTMEDASVNTTKNASDNAMEDASNAMEDASQLVEVTMRIEPSPRVSKPPKFNGAPGYILRALDKYYTEVISMNMGIGWR